MTRPDGARRARVLAAGAACLGVLAAGAVAAALGAHRVAAALVPLQARLSAPAVWTPAPGAGPAIPAPAAGSLALDAVGDAGPRSLVRSAAAAVRPIASVTKAMTALVVVEAHPLAAGEAGPLLTITAADVADYRAIAAAGGSVAPVEAGEHMSERDALLALMLPSANNIALTLARWVDGAVPAFVGRLNARAAVLGMSSTHFADPDGLSSQTTSTAADLVRLGEAVLAQPALVSVVSTTRATLPDGSVVTNLDALLGTEPGWLGVKTGWTPQAGGCLLFASRRPPTPGAPAVTLVGAVLGQPPDAVADAAHPELGAAFASARAATRAAYAGYTTVAAAALPATGAVQAPWGPASTLRLVAPARLLVRIGDALRVHLGAVALLPPARAGARAGVVTVSADGVVLGRYALVTDAPLAAPSVWWRLLH